MRRLVVRAHALSQPQNPRTLTARRRSAGVQQPPRPVVKERTDSSITLQLLRTAEVHPSADPYS